MGGRTQIGLVGCGSWGRFILRDLVALGCDVPVVARSETSRARAHEGGAAAVVGSIGELPEVEGIVIATPTTTHAAMIEKALERNVPVFVEKPLANDPIAADRLATAAPNRLFVMDKWRYHPGVELLGQIARSGELGTVIGVRAARLGWGNPHDVDAIWILAPHDLAIGLELLDEVPRPIGAVVDVTDGYGYGLLGVLGRAPWLTIEVSARAIQHRREVTLVCEGGVALLPDGYSDRVQIARTTDPRDTAPPEPEQRPISTELPLLRELRAFVEHIHGGPPPRSSAAEGAAIVGAISELRALAELER